MDGRKAEACWAGEGTVAGEHWIVIGDKQILNSLNRVRDWVERGEYRGYEPFDGLSSWARPLAFGNQLAERLLQQTIRQCPWNLRPVLGVRPKDSTKGRGYMAWGYLTLYRATQDKALLERALECLTWLDQHRVARFQHHSWSNHYDFVSRGGRYTKDDPIIVWTSIIGHAFVDAFEITGMRWCLDTAESACNWIMELPREKTAQGDCVSYFHHTQSSIHNANMLGASLLARAAKHTGSEDFFRVAQSAMLYSCSRQRPDGSWWYAEAPKYHWIDNFHTGYNLDSLDIYVEATGDRQFAGQLEAGLRFYKANFFESSGRPKYYHGRTYPVDIQCAAQSIDTLARFAVRDRECAELAGKVASWTVSNMQHPTKGFFYYRQYPLVTAKTPMLHWGQATMFKALAELACYRRSCSEPAATLAGSRE
jgi:polysaccharide biosynthesis protein VpsJ